MLFSRLSVTKITPHQDLRACVCPQEKSSQRRSGRSSLMLSSVSRSAWPCGPIGDVIVSDAGLSQRGKGLSVTGLPGTRQSSVGLIVRPRQRLLPWKCVLHYFLRLIYQQTFCEDLPCVQSMPGTRHHAVGPHGLLGNSIMERVSQN